MISTMLFFWHSTSPLSNATPVISHCSPNEVVVFNCETNGKTASLCASKSAGGEEWQAQYRFGYSGIIEQTIPDNPIPTKSNSVYEKETVDPKLHKGAIKLITDENYLNFSVTIDESGDDVYNNRTGTINGQQCTGTISMLGEQALKNIGIKQYDTSRMKEVYDHQLLMAHINYSYHRRFFTNLTEASSVGYGKECYRNIEYTYTMFAFDELAVSPTADGFTFTGVLDLGVSCEYYRSFVINMTSNELRPFLVEQPAEPKPTTLRQKTEKEIIDEFMSGLNFGANSDSGDTEELGGIANLDANTQSGLGGVLGTEDFGSKGGYPSSSGTSQSERGKSDTDKGDVPVSTSRSGGVIKAGGTPIILGSLDKSLIDTVIRKNMNQLRYCYQRELTKNPGLEGKIIVKFTIAPDGSVSRSGIKTSSMGNSDVETCLTERFKRFKFPEPKGGGVVIVSYPFVFGS